MYCYIFLWAFKALEPHGFTYPKLYAAAMILYCFNLVFDIGLRSCGVELHLGAFRNFIFDGLPMFVFGLFIKDRESRLPRLSGRGCLLFSICCIAIGYIQRVGFGGGEATLGMVVFAAGVVLWCSRHPKLLADSGAADLAAATAGKLSLFVYIVHPMVGWTIKQFAGDVDVFGYINAHGTLKPFAIIAVTILTGLLCIGIMRCMRRLKRMP